MGDRISEDYLEKLLNSIDVEEESAQETAGSKTETGEEALEREIFGETDSRERRVAKNEEEFMREFEAELLREDIPDYMESFEREMTAATGDGKKNLAATIDELLDHMPQVFPDESGEETKVDEGAEFQGELPEEIPKETSEQAAGGVGEEHKEEVTEQPREQGRETPSGLPLTEDGEIDLSGMSESDLMDMLSGDHDLSDLGDLLSIDEEGVPIEEEDAIGDFAEAEMEAQEQAAETEGGEASVEKEKKPGFLERLKRLLFGEDEEDEELTLKEGEGADAATLSAENEQILKELEETDKAEEKKKEKKAKKEKKKKPKKAKKQKQPKPKKPKKPKKEKPPKEPDNTPPLPKGPVIAIVVMAASLFGLVMLGTNLLGYQVNISTAQSVADSGDYVSAFENLQGITVKQKDQELYSKLEALAAVSEKYEDYLVFENYGAQDMALDSLVCAYGRYDLNKKYARAYDCEEEFEELNSKIVNALLSEYDMTGEEALSIYEIENRHDYTRAILRKLRDLGMEE